MALAMAFVSEAMRQFDTTVIVDQKDWADLMTLFKFPIDQPGCILDRMHLKSVVGGYEGLQQRMGELLAERDQLQAKVKELEMPKPEPVLEVAVT